MDNYEVQCAKDDTHVLIDAIQGTEECKTLKTLMNYINHLEETLEKRAAKAIKLNDLREALRANIVKLYLGSQVLKYEIWGLDDETKSLAEYRKYDEVESRQNDTMFKDYGEYRITEFSTDKNGSLNIVIEL